jgi:hypothetical protein
MKRGMARYRLFPYSVAKRQAAWDRRMWMLRFNERHSELTLRKLGAVFSLSAERTRQLLHRADRERNRSPIERYFGEQEDIPLRRLPFLRAAHQRLGEGDASGT